MNSILTVSQINTYISLKFRSDTKLRGIALRGEILNFSRNSRSGHLYFSLCDSGGSIRAIMFSTSAQKLRFEPFDGMSVIAYGNIDVYERDGIYQINVSQLIPDGEGNAYLGLLKLKEKLNALGVFSAPKRPIPRYPASIAVVTSPNGAALQDVKSIVSKRYPVARLLLFPASVQGDAAPEEISSALKKADESGADVIILTRGGGAAEDLSAFNTEAVVLAVYGCNTPVISAVGHEIDLTFCDLAADLRAPTPSAAAVLATPDISELRTEVSSIAVQLDNIYSTRLMRLREELGRYEFVLTSMSVNEKLKARRTELDSVAEAVSGLANRKLEVSNMALDSLSGLLESLSPKNVISRGYALVLKNGMISSDAEKLSAGDSVKIIMRGGDVDVEVKKVNGDSYEI